MGNGFLHENLDSDKTCDFPEELLASYGDWDRTGLDEADIARIEAHLSKCEHCRKVLAAEQAFTALFGEVITTGSDYADSPPADKTNVEVDNDNNAHSHSAASAPAAQNGWAEFIPYGSAPVEIPEEIRQRCRQKVYRHINTDYTFCCFFARFVSTKKLGSSLSYIRRFAGIAAMLTLAFGVAWFASNVIDKTDVTKNIRVCRVAQDRQHIFLPLPQLRTKFDGLVQQKFFGRINSTDFCNGTYNIINDCHEILAQTSISSEKFIHAKKLLADAYGVLGEYQKEFNSYLEYSIALASYYDTHDEKKKRCS